jgi:hypothetical protein
MIEENGIALAATSAGEKRVIQLEFNKIAEKRAYYPQEHRLCYYTYEEEETRSANVLLTKPLNTRQRPIRTPEIVIL